MCFPECSIGHFTDGVACHFLPRLPGEMGIYLGLTGHLLKGVASILFMSASMPLPAVWRACCVECSLLLCLTCKAS